MRLLRMVLVLVLVGLVSACGKDEPAAVNAPNAANLKTVTLSVPGMTCAACPITVRKALEKVPGVVRAQADFDSKTATVRFDPARTDIKALIAAVKNAGYAATLKKPAAK